MKDNGKTFINRRAFLKMSALAGAGVLLAGCEALTGTPNVNTAPAMSPSATPVAPKENGPTSTPKADATETPKAVQGGSGGPIEQKFLDEIDSSEYIKGQKDLMKKWIEYWGHGQDALMTPDWNKKSVEIVFDPSNMPTGANDPKLAEKVNILLLWDRTNPDNTVTQVRSYIPINSKTGTYQTEPPHPDGTYKISDRDQTGTLNLTDHQPSQLVWRKNQWVQVTIADAKSSAVVERIQNKPPFGWEAATMDAAPVLNESKVVASFAVTAWDRQNIDSETSKNLIGKSDADLVALAPKISPENVQQIFPAIPDHTFAPETVVRNPTGEVYVKYVDQQDRMTSLWWNVSEGTILQRKDTVQNPEDKWIAQGRFFYNPKDMLDGAMQVNPDEGVSQKIYEEMVKGLYNLSRYLTVVKKTGMYDGNFIPSEAASWENFLSQAKSGHEFSFVMVPWGNMTGESPDGSDISWMDKVTKIPNLRLDKIAVRVLDKKQADAVYTGDAAKKPVMVDAGASQAYELVEINGIQYLQVTILPSAFVACDVDQYKKYALDEPCSSQMKLSKVPPTEQNNLLAANQTIRMAAWLPTTHEGYAYTGSDWVGAGFYLKMSEAWLDAAGNTIVNRTPEITDKNGNVIQIGLWIDEEGHKFTKLPSDARVLTRSDWPNLYQKFATKNPLFVTTN